ncbi:YeeE/YedE family protein [Pseudohoeflea coraliihabitans]|uniref:YeeE/YedE family protein n=1 Tax=Pseudohoeflea coraliihabitans TaxID=2860393 RepID=A0ABS6WLT1_9HYPH|nr:YeeE/YedE family protein [Pseudohoeflea sp. DP4N28-3]MBW3096908.1 YeeE/YedE family protein [Pseudohoeflea sp. DP4N28-3]
MDLVPLFDTVGEAGAALVGGAVLGLLFGFFAQRSAFCTRSAVLDLTRRRDLKALATWLAGFAIAIFGVQLLIWSGHVEVRETRFFSTAQSLSGALIGGLVFGIGMVLTRGCVSRLMVLGASGNLRAITSILIVALVGYATYTGILVPLRDLTGGLLSTQAVGGNDILAQFGIRQISGVILGAALLLGSLFVAWKSRLPLWRYGAGALVGATIVGGWYFTYQLSIQAFEPVQAESLSFIRPLATTIQYALGSVSAAGFDQGILLGIFAGAFLAALLFRDLRLAKFGETGTPSVFRYVGGAALMGFGGILAVGCTIGAGFTGGSVLALSSLLGLASMVAGAAVTDLFIDRRSERQGRAPDVIGKPSGALTPAE